MNAAGEYLIDGIKISAFPCFHDRKRGALRGDNLAFLYEIDGLRICHLGDLGESDAPELIKKLLPVDILMIPVGGNYTIDGREAKNYIDRIQPSVVIPMHFKTDDLNIDIAGLDEFLNCFDRSFVVRASSAVELTADCLTDKIKIIVMERKK